MMIVTFQPVQGQLKLPIGYQSVIQGWLYRSIMDPKLADFLHNTGYVKENRVFKLFTFSRLFGKYEVQREERTISFSGEITLYFNSIVPGLMESLAEKWLREGVIRIAQQAMEVVGLQIKKESVGETGKYKIKMLAPIVVYSTIETSEGKKKSIFYHPMDMAFSLRVQRNLYNKSEAFYGQAIESRLQIRPILHMEKNKIVTRFKDFIYTGWNGEYEIETSPEAMNFLIQTGIGSANSMGFGLFQLCETEASNTKNVVDV